MRLHDVILLEGGMIIVIEKKSGESNEICEDGEKKSGGGVVTQKFAHVKLRINMYKLMHAHFFAQEIIIGKSSSNFTGRAHSSGF